jgi:hypothetical protein
MRFLFVGSHLCPPASFRQALAGLPLPSASGYPDCIGSSHRGLSPHKLMPMSGVHNAMQRTASQRACARCFAAADRERWASLTEQEDRNAEQLYRRFRCSLRCDSRSSSCAGAVSVASAGRRCRHTSVGLLGCSGRCRRLVRVGISVRTQIAQPWEASLSRCRPTPRSSGRPRARFACLRFPPRYARRPPLNASVRRHWRRLARMNRPSTLGASL